MSRATGTEGPALYRTETAFEHLNNTFHGSPSEIAFSAGDCIKMHPEYANFRTPQFICSVYLCPDWSRMAEPLLKELKRIETS
jgi:hypothetical protein